jgi:hypothetical protein
MGIYINYIFTSEPLRELKARGFFVHNLPPIESEGYIPSQIIFTDETIYELREILDEELYLKKFKIQRFEPRATEKTSFHSVKFVNHPNGIESLVPQEENKAILENSNVRDYLKWRKPSPLKALTFSCKNLDHFKEVAHPEKQFQIDQETYLLIHLGPNCIDLLVRENHLKCL